MSQNSAGDLVATGSGFTANSSLQYELYSAPQASVGGGQVSTDASGNFSADFGSAAWFMSVYPNETSLNLTLYPIVGNKASMGTVAATCTY